MRKNKNARSFCFIQTMRKCFKLRRNDEKTYVKNKYEIQNCFKNKLIRLIKMRVNHLQIKFYIIFQKIRDFHTLSYIIISTKCA